MLAAMEMLPDLLAYRSHRHAVTRDHPHRNAGWR